MYECSQLAMKYFNDRGGILGRPLETVYYDVEDTAAEKLEAAAQEFMRLDVDAVVTAWAGAGADVIAFGKLDCPYIMWDVSQVCVDLIKDNPEYSNCFHTGDVPAGYGLKQWTQWMLFEKDGYIKFPNHKLAIIHSDFELDLELAASVQAGAEEAGWEIVMNEEVPFGVMEWGPILTKLKTLMPAIVYMEIEYPPDMIVFHRQFREVAEEIGALEMQGYGYSIPGFRNVLLEEGDGIIGQTFCAPFWGSPSELFWDAYEAMWQKEPVLATAACTYSNYFVVADAWERVGGTEDREAVCKAIEEFPAETPKAIFDLNRPGHYMPTGPNLPMMCLQTQNGQFTWLYEDMHSCTGTYGPFSGGEFILPDWLDPEEWQYVPHPSE
jgi:ABC-type branched-subunit amino acid transport system substrate-binding protein